MKTEKYGFYYENEEGEGRVFLEVNEDAADIYDFRDICERFAAALGYTHDSIARAFETHEE